VTASASVDARVLEGLVSLRDLLADPERWTQGAAARDATGEEMGVNRAAACRWCLTGGVRRIAGTGLGLEMLRVLARHLPPGSPRLAAFNDTHTHADVLDLVDRTIQDLARDDR
jgi:hypothetical protein